MRIPYRNYVRFAGFVGNDVTLRKLESGDEVCSIRIGSKHSWKDAKGNWQEATEWATAVFYRQDAVDVHAVMKKGDFIDVEARKHTRKWMDKPGGTERRTEELIVQSWHPIDLSHIRQPGTQPVNHADAQQGASPGRGKRQPTYDFSK